MRMYRSILLCLTLFSCLHLNGQDFISIDNGTLLSLQKNIKSTSEIEEQLAQASYYEIDQKQLRQLYSKNYKSLNWTINTPQGEKQLILQEVDLFADTYLLTSSSGDLPKDISRGVFYHGSVQGEDRSLVALSIFEDELKVLISNEQGDFEIHKYEASKYIGYYNNDVLKKRESFCETSDEGVEVNITHSKQKKSAAGSCVEVYLECDNQSFKDNGSSVSKTQNWATALFNEVKVIYKNEGITLKLSQVKVWNTPDPYRSKTNVSGMLGAFASNVRNNYNGRLAQLLTTRVSGGIAWVDMLCANYNTGGNFGPYSVCGGMNTSKIKVPNYSWNVHVMAHELGHSFGSPHSHACRWGPGKNQALDNCQSSEGSCSNGPTPSGGGTIMSYCHLSGVGVSFSKGFGTEPGNLIRSKMNASKCVTGCASTAPLANDKCAQATLINVTKTCSPQSFTNVGATASGTTPPFSCGNTGSTKDVWFKVRVPASGKLDIETTQITSGLTDMIMQVYSGSCNNLVRITCQDDDVVRHAKASLTGRPANQQLYLRIVDYKSDDFGNFGLCAYSDGGGGTDPGCTTQGNSCNDGDVCTTNDRINASCECEGTLADADGDGICDANDVCPGGDDTKDADGDNIPDHCDSCNNNLAGKSCNDGDVCTTNDKYDANCNCAGTLLDSDGDGVCDGQDICPGGDDSKDADGDGTPDHCDSCNGNIVGQSCNDGNACTTNDRYDASCNCKGTLIDSDGDGVCDRDDVCPGGDDRLDSDRDGIPNHCDSCNNNLIGRSCNDGNDCTTNDRYNASCQCVGTYKDSDRDGVCDANDICPGGNDNIDSDGDGIPNHCDDCDESLAGQTCNDGNACTTNDRFNDSCDCVGVLRDADNDGVCDSDDKCPGGDDRRDADFDGIPDLCDNCDGRRVGTRCDDRDDCTTNDRYNSNCQCIGDLIDDDRNGVCDNDENCQVDSDGDGVCDADDMCPGGDDNKDDDNDGQPDFCQACEEDHKDVNGVIRDQTEIVAVNTIEADPSIRNRGELTLVAEESISFSPGFEVEDRGLLTAIIDACRDYFNLKDEQQISEKK